MNYSEYTAEDLILNPDFRDWVINPTVVSNKFWENWLKQYPEKIEELKKAKSILKAIPLEYYQIKDNEVNEMWRTLEGATSGNDETYSLTQKTVINQYRNKPVQNKYGFWKRAQQIAAAVVLIIGFVYGFTVLNNRDYNEETELDEDALITKENPKGQKSTIYLMDGSKVVLNARSRLSFPERFSSVDRIVNLEGEAFFEVAKDSDRSFKVISGDITTLALGTSFNINTRNNEVHVALSTGKVLVSNNSSLKESKTILNPGQSARYIGKTNELIKGKFDDELTLGWKEQKIVFKKANEHHVFSTLENWYAVDIAIVNKTSLNWDYSGEFENMDLNSVLLSIGFTMGFEYTIEEQNVTINYTKSGSNMEK